MIHLKNISLSFGAQTIFDGISCDIDLKRRIGLVGRNGTGKSTLLKVIGSSEGLTSGSINMPKHLKLAYLPQEVVLTSALSVLDEALEINPELASLLRESKQLEEQLLMPNPSEELVSSYASICTQLAELEAPKVQAEAKKILMGLGFSIERMSKPVRELSTGWKMRLLLAKLLMQRADFYLFDEPTNHLDIFAKDWFLKFLAEADFGFMIVCHERYFLDKVCDSIFELEGGGANSYTGGYTAYEHQKAENTARKEAAFEQQQREIKQKQATIDRFKAKASKAGMAQSMMKALDKIERIELDRTPNAMSFKFTQKNPSGREVLTVKDVSHAFGDQAIFTNVSFDIERGQKVALIAPNGTGKTTLFNIISGIYKRQEGSIELGYNVEHAIFAQDYNDSLVLRNTILNEIERVHPAQTQQRIRTALGSFLFRKDDVHKKIEVLSGGEKNRVRLVNVLLKEANFLMLDEPTNHLDLQSKEILLNALKDYPGTMLFVSHDHDFINTLATHVFELTSQGVASYIGNYEDYCHQKSLLEQNSKASTLEDSVEKEAVWQTSSKHEKRKQGKKLEQKIKQLEESIKNIEAQLQTVDYASQKFVALYKTLEQSQQEYQTIFNEWEKLQALIAS